MSRPVPAKLKFPTPVSRLDHFQKWLAAMGSRITVRWHKHSCDLYVFEGGHRNHKSNFDEARIFLSGVDEGRRDFAEQRDVYRGIALDAVGLLMLEANGKPESALKSGLVSILRHLNERIAEADLETQPIAHSMRKEESPT